MKNIKTISIILLIIINLILTYKLIDTSISLAYANASEIKNIKTIKIQKKIINIISVDASYDAFVKTINSGTFGSDENIVKIQPNSIEIDELTLIFKNGVLKKLQDQ
jgi:hypothetical protein